MNCIRVKVTVIILSYIFSLACIFNLSENLYAGGCYSLFGTSKEEAFLGRVLALLYVQENPLIIKELQLEDFDKILRAKTEYERLKIYVESLRLRKKVFNSKLKLSDIFDSSNEKFKNLVREFGIGMDELMIDIIYPNSKSVVVVQGIDNYPALFTEEGALKFLYDVEYGLNEKDFLINTSIYDKLSMYKSLAGTEQDNKGYYLDRYNKIISLFLEILNSELFQEGIEQLSNHESLSSFYNNRIFIQIQHIIIRVSVLLDLDNKQSIKLRAVIKKMFITINKRIHDYSCTGVVVSSNTLITAGHCLAESNASTIVYYKAGKMMVAKSIYRHKSVDLGIVRFPDGTFLDIKPVRVSFNVVNLKDKLIAIGTSGKSGYKHLGSVRVDKIKNGSIQDIFTIGSVNYVLEDGDSGGALFDKNGDLVGIAVGTRVYNRTKIIQVEGKQLKLNLESISDYFTQIPDRTFWDEAFLYDPEFRITGINK